MPKPKKRSPQQIAAAQVAADPTLAYNVSQAQHDLSKRTKQFKTESGSIKGAVKLASNAVANTNTKLGGIEGQQLRQEVRGRTKDIKRSLPYLLADAQQKYKADRSDLRQAVVGAEMDRSSAMQDALNKVLQNRTEAGQKAQYAFGQAKRLIHEQVLTNADPKADAKDKGPPVPQSELEWMHFTDHLAGSEGIDPTSAEKAVAHLRKKIAKNTSKIKGQIPWAGN